MPQAPEVRLVTAELRDVQAVGKPYRYLEGRAVPYGVFADVNGWFLEAHQVDSFKRSTKGGSGKNLPLLLFHDNQGWPIGHAESWDHRSDGMHGVWRLNELPEAQRAAQMAESMDLTGLSVGFQPVQSAWEYVDDWDPDLGPGHMDRVTRLESRLLEVSITPTPAFADAGITAVRTAETREGHIQRRAREHPPRIREIDTWRQRLEELRYRQ